MVQDVFLHSSGNSSFLQIKWICLWLSVVAWKSFTSVEGTKSNHFATHMLSLWQCGRCLLGCYILLVVVYRCFEGLYCHYPEGRRVGQANSKQDTACTVPFTPGYTCAECVARTRAGIDRVLSWNGGTKCGHRCIKYFWNRAMNKAYMTIVLSVHVREVVVLLNILIKMNT